MTQPIATVDERQRLAYQVLTTQAALLPRPEWGLVELTDADRVDFVQRMSTNDVARLQPGQAAVTVFTDPTARILFVCTVLRHDDALWLLSGPDQAPALARYLQSQIFFMDKVKVRDRSPEYVRLRLMGPTAADVLDQVGLPIPPADGHFLQAEDVWVLREERLEIPGFELLVPADQADAWRGRLHQAGAHPVDLSVYHVRRVELGLPGFGHELVSDYNPLEVGLAWACAENKGCYTGQEVIARQVTYDKITRYLVRLYSPALLSEGADVLAQGRKVGRVTSSVYSIGEERPLSLAVVRRPHHSPGTRLEADGQEVEVAPPSAG